MVSLSWRKVGSVPPGATPRPTFAELYERHFSFVWRTLGYLGIRGAAQEDAAQEVFLVVHRRHGEFLGNSEVRTWLYAIARNTARNYRRSLQRRGEHEELSPEIPAQEKSPEENTKRSEALDFIHRFLEGLEEARRDAFLLCELEQLTAAEAGAILGASPNTVSSRLRLAREAFHKAAKDFREKGENHDS